MTCLRCGSDAIIPNVRLVDQDANGSRKTAEVALARKPDATFFKGDVRMETRAWVCGDCGFVELRVVNPGALWEAHIEREANRLMG
jgi:hypothetical protein